MPWSQDAEVNWYNAPVAHQPDTASVLRTLLHQHSERCDEVSGVSTFDGTRETKESQMFHSQVLSLVVRLAALSRTAKVGSCTHLMWVLRSLGQWMLRGDTTCCIKRTSGRADTHSEPSPIHTRMPFLTQFESAISSARAAQPGVSPVIQLPSAVPYPSGAAVRLGEEGSSCQEHGCAPPLRQHQRTLL